MSRDDSIVVPSTVAILIPVLRFFISAKIMAAREYTAEDLSSLVRLGSYDDGTSVHLGSCSFRETPLLLRVFLSPLWRSFFLLLAVAVSYVGCYCIQYGKFSTTGTYVSVGTNSLKL